MNIIFLLPEWWPHGAHSESSQADHWDTWQSIGHSTWHHISVKPGLVWESQLLRTDENKNEEKRQDCFQHYHDGFSSPRQIVPRVSNVSVVSNAGGDPSSDTFTAVGAAQRLARTPFGHLPVVCETTATGRVGTVFDFLQRRTSVVVNGISDDWTFTPPLSVTLKWQWGPLGCINRQLGSNNILR